MSSDQRNSCPNPDLRKQSLELEKLHAEIRNLTYRWWIPPAIQAGPTLFLVLATVIIAFWSGLLDAKRERNAIENERLRIEQLTLAESVKETEATIRDLGRQLSQAQSQVAAFEGEKSSIQLIRRLLPASTIEYLDQEEGFRICLVPHSAYNFEEYPANIAIQSPHTREALSAVGSIHNVGELEIKGLTLEEPELQELSKLTTIRRLLLSSNSLNNDLMKSFPVLPEITRLYLINQRFTTAPRIGRFPNLRSIKLFATPVSDEMMTALAGCGETLEFLGLQRASVTDRGLSVLSRFPKLNNVYLVHTEASVSGIRKLAAMQSMRSIAVDGGLFSEELATELKQKYPELSFGTTNDPPLLPKTAGQ